MHIGREALPHDFVKYSQNYPCKTHKTGQSTDK